MIPYYRLHSPHGLTIVLSHITDRLPLIQTLLRFCMRSSYMYKNDITVNCSATTLTREHHRSIFNVCKHNNTHAA